MIKRFLKLFKSLFSNYKLSIEEKEFISLNENIWPSYNAKKTGILVEGFLDSPTSIVEKSRLANAAREVTGLEVKVIVRGFFKKPSNVVPIYQSFGFSNYDYWWLNYVNPFVFFPAIVSFFYIMCVIKTGDVLVKYKKGRVLIGDLIYDSLIRNIPNSYTLRKLCFFKHSRLLFRSMIFYYGNQRLLRAGNIKVVVTSHNVYAEYGMLCRQAHALGAIVILKDMDVYKLYSLSMNVNEHFLKMSDDIFQEEVVKSDLEKEKEYYRSRVLGLSNQIDIKNAYKNKRTYTKSETIALHADFNKNKKNVFVMAHAFSDAPHVGEGLLFRDYYDFLEETLKELNTNHNVNCFVKAHPSSYMWGEKGGVENIIEKNRLDNICILPLDYNTNSIISVADVIVTAKGTAGLEFSCSGIPAITAGQGYYYGFGICHEPETITDYNALLARCEQFPRLSDDIICKALIVLYHSFNHLFHSKVLPAEPLHPGDDYQALFRSKFAEMTENMKSGISMKDDFYMMVIHDLNRVFNEK